MPCNSDHLETTLHEKESRKIAQHLVYVYSKLAPTRRVPLSVQEAADNYYGNQKMIHEFTKMLCGTLRNLKPEEKEALFTSEKKSLKLQLWWAEHQEADEKKAKKEADLGIPVYDY